ncbi:M28 family metallopeptidase [Spongiivirga citrea]|uniref:M28 family peptidase n=1 Tax=Spongiivirga citrea TaxID=1481457 RepID=A0A6M0CJG5_9FLAO|nr:M28 family peptidase [Spongiivirga citrea]NER15587.1 M28 family peptidase [Spongiivirga citrea]
MKKILFVALLSFLGCKTNHQAGTQATAKKTVADPVTYAATITSGELSDHLYTYASDEFEGRETGAPGQKKAIAYLKDAYVKMGIPAANGDGNYFQPVPLERTGVPEGSIAIDKRDYKIGEAAITYAAGKSGTTNFTDLVYAGYGIEDEKYSDYTDLNIKGKVVLIKAGEPKNADGTFKISGSSETSKWSNLRQAFGSKIEAAKDKGAAGILFYDGSNIPLLKGQYDMMKKRAASGGGSMRLADKKDDFFYLFINKSLANAFFDGIDTYEKSKEITKSFSITFNSSSQKVDSENVVAYIKGSETPDEYVVISAHLDHEGIKDGKIYNGADDDGSGTVSILEIAQAFKQAEKDGNGPKRSMVFLHVTGEEKGLLGSEYYSNNPIFPMSQTVADLNIDMIGRTDPKRKEGRADYIYLIGSDKLSTELHELSEAVNTKYTNLELDYTYNDENDPNRFYYRSDHYNFAKHNVPIIFYFNGTHDDYHQPSDTPDKIEYELMAKRAQLVFHTAWEVANRDKRIIADKAEASAE